MFYENKKSIVENDVILVYVEDKPAFFARIEKIVADTKKGWWQVTFLILSIPLKTYTWILDNEQIRGADFTMGGTPMRIEVVKAPDQSYVHSTQDSSAPKNDDDTPDSDKSASILSFKSKKST